LAVVYISWNILNPCAVLSNIYRRSGFCSAREAIRDASPSSLPRNHGSEGKYVKVGETVRGFKEIVEGKHDDLPEGAFYLVGTIDEAVAILAKGHAEAIAGGTRSVGDQSVYGRVLDSTAITLCMDNHLPIIVLNLWRSGSIEKAVLGQEIGTLVS
jgi:hypothetical protein